MRTPPVIGVRIGAHFNTNEYMHKESTMGFGVRISGRKYLNWCTPFSDVSQCKELGVDFLNGRNRHDLSMNGIFIFHDTAKKLKEKFSMLAIGRICYVCYMHRTYIKCN